MSQSLGLTACVLVLIIFSIALVWNFYKDMSRKSVDVVDKE